MIKFHKLDFNPESIFITSDLHYNHKNISRDSVWDRVSSEDNIRPWGVKEMNDYIINEINSKVPWDGLLIHMGDFSFGGYNSAVELRANIFCENVITCFGNHDHNIINKPDLRGMFIIADHILYLNIAGQDIVCCHYPIGSWHQQNKGSWMLHGHCHGSYLDSLNLKQLDVGFDTKLYGHEQYTLYSFSELQQIMKQKSFVPVDHHL